MKKLVQYQGVVEGVYSVIADLSDEVAAFIDECERKDCGYLRSCRRHHLCSLDEIMKNKGSDHRDTLK